MQLTDSPRAEGIRRLYELMLRVNSSTDLSEVLDEIARGVVEVLGYGIAAIARLEGETFVMTTVAGPEEVREQIIGRRTPVASHLQRVRPGRRVGRPPLRPARPAARRARGVGLGAGLRARQRPPTPGTPSTRSTPRSTPPPASCSATCRSTCRPATGSRTARSASCSRCSWCRRAWRCTTPSSVSGSATRSAWARCSARSPRPGSCAELDLSLREAAQAIADGPRRRAHVDPLLPDGRRRAGRASPRRTHPTTASPATSWSRLKSLLAPARPRSSAGRS